MGSAVVRIDFTKQDRIKEGVHLVQWGSKPVETDHHLSTGLEPRRTEVESSSKCES